MTVASSVMLDTEGITAHNIPKSTHYVAGYVSGLDDVPWTQAQFDSFPTIRKVRIWQGAGIKPSLQAYDVIDVETGAVTPAMAAQAVHDRVQAGIPWTTVYATESNLALVTTEIKKFGEAIWNGHVNYWLANWNLNEAEAIALLDTYIHGGSCVAVQWASPSSNPNTVVPGGSQTLSQANIDISAVDANWVPSGGFGPTPPPTPPPVTYNGVLVTVDTQGNFHSRAVTSHDDVNWQ